jgi:hypothetical protein
MTLKSSAFDNDCTTPACKVISSTAVTAYLGSIIAFASEQRVVDWWAFSCEPKKWIDYGLLCGAVLWVQQKPENTCSKKKRILPTNQHNVTWFTRLMWLLLSITQWLPRQYSWILSLYLSDTIRDNLSKTRWGMVKFRLIGGYLGSNQLTEWIRQ